MKRIILKKTRIGWVAASLLLVSIGMTQVETNHVNAKQEFPIETQLLQEGYAKFANKDKFLKDKKVQDYIETTMKKPEPSMFNTVEMIRAEMKVQKDLPVYVIQPGDTLGNIATAAEMNLEEIMSNNGIEDETLIQVGDILMLEKEITDMNVTLKAITSNEVSPSSNNNDIVSEVVEIESSSHVEGDEKTDKTEDNTKNSDEITVLIPTPVEEITEIPVSENTVESVVETTKEEVTQAPKPVEKETTQEATSPAKEQIYKLNFLNNGKAEYRAFDAKSAEAYFRKLMEMNGLTDLVWSYDAATLTFTASEKIVVEETTQVPEKEEKPIAEETSKEVVDPAPIKEQIFKLNFLNNGKTEYKALDAKSAEAYFRKLMEMNGLTDLVWSYDAATLTFTAIEKPVVEETAQVPEKEGKPVVEETTNEAVKPTPTPIETTTEVVNPKPIDEVVPEDEVVEETSVTIVDEPVKPEPKPVFKPFDLELIRTCFHTLLNDYRVANGVSPIQVGIQVLQDAANQRAQEMEDYGNIRYVDENGTEMPHYRPDGTFWMTVLPDDLKDEGMSEIIGGTSNSYYEDGRNTSGVTQTDGTPIDEKEVAEGLFNLWKNSPGHNAIMISNALKTYALGLGAKETTPEQVKHIPAYQGFHMYHFTGAVIASNRTPAAETEVTTTLVEETTEESSSEAILETTIVTEPEETTSVPVIETTIEETTQVSDTISNEDMIFRDNYQIGDVLPNGSKVTYVGNNDFKSISQLKELSEIEKYELAKNSDDLYFYAETDSNGGFITHAGNFSSNFKDEFNKGNLIDFNVFNQEFMKLLNQERQSKSLKEVTFDPNLKAGTQLRSQELFQSLEHIRPDGSAIETAFKDEVRSEYDIRLENIAGKDYSSDPKKYISGKFLAEEWFNIWKNSPGHYRTMMVPDYDVFYVGAQMEDVDSPEGKIRGVFISANKLTGESNVESQPTINDVNNVANSEIESQPTLTQAETEADLTTSSIEDFGLETNVTFTEFN